MDKQRRQLKTLAKQAASRATGVPVSQIGKGKHPVITRKTPAKGRAR